MAIILLSSLCYGSSSKLQRRVAWWASLLVVVLLVANKAEGQRRRMVRCRPVNPRNPRECRGVFMCPRECPQTCLADCTACRPVCTCNRPGAVCQDPRFVGGDGLTFHFHGRKDQDFCLVSDSNLHINAHFIGKRGAAGMKRDFTWVQSLGILFNNNHSLLLSAHKTSKWDDFVDRLDMSLDGKPLSILAKAGSKWSDPNSQVTISRASDTNHVVVEVADNLKITANVVPITAEESKTHGYGITEEDCFAHLELGFKFYNLTDEVDGVLGQTYRSNYVSRINIGSKMPVMGGADKFRTSGGLFATDCMVSRFGKSGKRKEGAGAGADYQGIKCTSGMEGKGLVCRR